ncbi:MAG: hypothetical protein AAF366_10610 [Pseudomonadota bacterium]
MTQHDDPLTTAGRHLRAAADAIEAAIEDRSKAGSKQRSKGPSKSRPRPPTCAADHLRQHRPGYPSKIDTDPDLRAFIFARIDTMSFPKLDAAAAFPPDRRLGKTAIHKWWTRNMARHRR